MKLLIALLAALVTAASASAGASPLHQTDWRYDFQDPVEQQSPNWFYNDCSTVPPDPICDPSTWVHNPYPCAWDVDDYTNRTGSGDLAANEIYTDSVCEVADHQLNFGDIKHVQAGVWFSSNDLQVTLISSQGESYPAEIVPSGKGYLYRVCLRDERTGPFATIPDSNGGYGLRVDYTLQITNPRHTKAGKIRYLLTSYVWFEGIYASPCVG